MDFIRNREQIKEIIRELAEDKNPSPTPEDLQCDNPEIWY